VSMMVNEEITTRTCLKAIVSSISSAVMANNYNSCYGCVMIGFGVSLPGNR
jgi:hypothetical protein